MTDLNRPLAEPLERRLLLAANYALTPLGDLPGGDFHSVAHDVNDDGTVVGVTADGSGEVGFTWTAADGMVRYGGQGTNAAIPHTISDAGWVAGATNGQPFRAAPGGNPTTLPGGTGVAFGVNDAGKAVGSVNGDAAYWEPPFPFGSPKLLPQGDAAHAISDGGVIVGEGQSFAMRWGNWQSPASSLDFGEARGVNDAGHVAGWTDASGPRRAFLWTPGGLDTLGSPAGSEANDLNDAGEVVGANPAFHWSASEGFRDLNTLVGAGGAGWTLDAATAINDAGQIVGRGTNAQGNPEAFLLTPANGPPVGGVVTERVSVATGGGQGSGGSYRPSISADGRFVSFESIAPDLVAGDTNGVPDIFVHDRQSGTTERVSVATGGGQVSDGSFNSVPSISADGRFVSFDSYAPDLVAGDTNGYTDVFVHDRQSGTTERVSVATGGGQGGDFSYAPSISADGRFVSFHSDAPDLVVGDTNGARDVFVHDRQAGTTERVSVATGGGQGSGGSGSYRPSISADGRFVSFDSYAPDLVAGDTNGVPDIFVHDRQSGTTERVSVATGGGQGNGYSYDPSISADGRFVSFGSSAPDLVAGDTNGVADVFVSTNPLFDGGAPAAGLDLTVPLVTAGAATVEAGQPLSVTFQVHNAGPAAAPASEARLRLSRDRTLTRYDEELALRVPVPPIPAGGSVTITTTHTVPAATPAGAYHVGVFADWNNTAGQRDETNDAGLSTGTIQVTAPAGTVGPVIDVFRGPEALDVGGDATFEVDLRRPGTYSFQWFRDDKPLPRHALSTRFDDGDSLALRNVTAGEAGTYRVEVSNAAGTATSSSVTLGIDGEVQVLEAGDSALLSLAPVNRNWPTVVVIHGWQPSLSGTHPGLPSIESDLQESFADRDREATNWFNDAVVKIYDRFDPPGPAGPEVNVLALTWSEAWTPFASTSGGPDTQLAEAGRGTVQAASDLTFFLARELGGGYDAGLHLVGHSLGTMVAARTVQNLVGSGIRVDQVTLLDPPTSAGDVGLAYTDNDYYRLIPDFLAEGGVQYVDNYIGNKKFPTSTPAVGDRIDGAAPDGGRTIPGADHRGVHAWYRSTIAAGGAQEGFELSSVFGAGGGNRPAPALWDPPEPTDGIIDRFYNKVINVVGNGPLPTPLIAAATLPAEEGWLLRSGPARNDTREVGGALTDVMVLGDADAASVGVDSVIALPMELPANATSLTMDIAFDAVGDGDWLAVYFNGTPLLTLAGTSWGDGGFRQVSVPLTSVAGSAGTLTVGLYAEGVADAEVAVANVGLRDDAAPVAVSGTFEYEAGHVFTVDFEDAIVVRDAGLISVLDANDVPVDPANYVLSTSGGEVVIELNGVLPDGMYSVNVAAGAVEDAVGLRSSADASFDFFVLAGDANRDRAVTIADFAILRSNFGRAGLFSEGDFNRDGVVSIADFAILRGNFGAALASPAAGLFADGAGEEDGLA